MRNSDARTCESRGEAIVLLALVSILVGCSTQPKAPEVNADDLPGVRISIAQAVKTVDEQRMRAKDAQQHADLSQPVMSAVNWEGEAAEILQRIATAQKLNFKITGPQPRLQLPVFIRLRNVTLNDALVAIGDQLGGRADVVLTDTRIELRMRMY